MKIGSHIGISDGIDKIKENTEKINADWAQIFVKSNRSFRDCTKLNPKKLQKFLSHENNLVVHGTYLINLANITDKTISAFHDELKRVEELKIKFFVLHPGSNVKKKNTKDVLKEIAEHLNTAMEKFTSIHICLENMAGQGNVLCRTIEELAEIISHIKYKERIGVCFDTCHAFAGGYKIHKKDGYEKFITDFDKKIGLNYLKVIHLNDSKTELGSRKDRHEELGKGKIGYDLFKWIVNDKRFDVPMILETPDPMKYKEEIELLKSFKK